MKTVTKLIAASWVFASFQTYAGLIDFETNALGLTPTDNQIVALSDVFEIDGVNVMFGFDTDNDGLFDRPAVYEEVGNQDANGDTGFWGIDGVKDVAALGYEAQLGNFFLRQFDPYEPFGTFMILYNANSPVTAASGEIWDIDGKRNKTEQFTVRAFNSDTLLRELISPLGDDSTLDGKPWSFGFSGLSNITRIEITFTGSKTRGIGLAFNNFSPVTNVAPTASVNEPLTALLLLPLLMLGYRRYRS